MKTIPVLSRTLFAFITVSLLTLSGCAATGGSSTADTSIMQAFQNYKAAWNSHDVPALVSCYGKNGTLNSPAIGQTA